MSKAAAPGAGVVDAALSSVDAALQAAANKRQASQNAADQERSDLRYEYLSILCRSQSPEPGDDVRLTELILALGLATADVRKDSTRIATAEAKIEVIAEEKTRDDAHKAALDALVATRDRHRLELDAAQNVLNRASAEARKAGWARNDLGEIIRDAPELFEPGLIELPADMASRRSKPDPSAGPAQRKGPKLTRRINGRDVEPLLDANGEYLRANGDYVFPVKPFPEPLRDDRGQPRYDAHGHLMFAQPKAASTLAAD